LFLGFVDSKFKKISFYICSLIFAFCFFFMPGCGGHGGSSSTTMAPSAPTTFTISGFVTSSVNGPPVQGASVSLLQNGSATGQSTTSGSDGSFALSNLPAGTYSVFATKSGYAASIYQNVVIGPSVSDLSLPMFPQNGIGTNGLIPTISLGAGTPGPGASVSGLTTFTINVSENGSNPNAILSIILRVGGNRVGGASNSATLSQVVNFNQFPAGSVPVTIVAQDVAGDVATWTYTVNNSGSGTAPNVSFYVLPLAQTFGQDLQILNQNRKVFWNKLHLSGNPSILEIPERNGAIRTIDLSATPKSLKPSSTVPGTTILVQVSVIYNSGSFPSGYNIYRATSPLGPFTLIGSVPSSNCGKSGCTDATFNDLDPSLTPGTTYYYQAAAYNGSSVGTPYPSNPPAVTILPPFHVNLVSPGGVSGSSAATTANTSTTPTLVWNNSGPVGVQQVYDPLVLSVTNNYTSTFLCGGNTLGGGSPLVVIKNGSVSSPSGSTITVSNGGATISFPFSNFQYATSSPNTFGCGTTPLQAGVMYEWDLVESIAQGSPYGSNFLAISVGNGQAYNGGEALTSGSDNGPFFFTTTP
jgi:hypothetical protein